MSEHNGPIYSMLTGKECQPCQVGDILVWQYQGYPSQAACEATGYEYCCLCVTNS